MAAGPTRFDASSRPRLIPPHTHNLVGESWEVALSNGLEGAAIVIPLMSKKAVDGIIANAHLRPDYLLMGTGGRGGAAGRPPWLLARRDGHRC